VPHNDNGMRSLEDVTLIRKVYVVSSDVHIQFSNL
jgi:hypothetical protein